MGVTCTCIALLGGSFDPVHVGHVALGNYFSKLLWADQLRIVPAGNPWQKRALHAAPQQRIDMIRIAFRHQPVPVVIDDQEIQRQTATYTIDTLRALRTEVGPTVSLAFLIGADQLRQLHTWHEWQQLFDYAHLCAASRPGFAIEGTQLSPQVEHEFRRRAAATPEQIRTVSHGLTYVATDLAIDVSSTAVRAALRRGAPPHTLLPVGVLDYIKHHHLYQN